jgi:hypothetical protein
VIGGQRLGRIGVEDRAAQLTGDERVQQRLLVHDAAAREVAEDGPRVEPRELALADQPGCLVVERGMYRQDVRVVQGVLEAVEPADPERAKALVAHVGIVSAHEHPEGEGARRHLAADPADADDRESSPLEFAAEQPGAVPSPVAHGDRGRGEMAQEADQGAEEQLRHRDGISRWRVDDGDAQISRGVDGDVVDADAGAPHDAEPCRAREQLGGDPRRAPPHERVVVPDARQQLRRREGRHLVDEEARLGGKQGDTLGVHFVGHENAKGHGGRPEREG